MLWLGDAALTHSPVNRRTILPVHYWTYRRQRHTDITKERKGLGSASTFRLGHKSLGDAE